MAEAKKETKKQTQTKQTPKQPIPEYREEKEYKEFLKELSKVVGKELTDVEDFKLDIQRYQTDYVVQSMTLQSFWKQPGKGYQLYWGSCGAS